MYFATGAALTAALNALPTSLTGTYKAFDAFYYANQYMGAYTGTLSPVEHFVQVGAARGYKPNADFDPTYYQSKFSDLANLDAADLLFHYVKFGLNEGRPGNSTLASYKWADYLAAYPDVAKYVNDNLASFGGSTANGAIAHYVKFGAAQGFVVPGAVAGATYSLTTGIDTPTGGAGNDTFLGTVDTTTATNNTFSVADVINGGAGTDTLQLTANVMAADTTWTPTQISNVENVRIVNVSSKVGTLDLTANTGVTSVEASSSSSAVTFSNIAAATATLSAVSNTADVNFNVKTTALTGAADNVNLSLTSQNGSVLVNANGAGFESATITAVGDNAPTALIGAAADLKTVTVSGAGKLTIPTNFLTAATKLDASANTGGISYAATALNASLTGGSGNDTLSGGNGNDVISGGAGNDSITAGAGNDSVDGGAGNDTVVLTAVSREDSVVGGDGTDTLSIATAIAYSSTSSTDESVNIKGFETLRTTAAITQDMTGLNLNNTMTGFTVGVAGTTTLQNAVGLATVTGSTTGNVTVGLKTNGTADALAVTVGNATVGSEAATTIGLNATQYETMTVDSVGANGNSLTLGVINAGDGITAAVNATATQLKSLTITGSKNLTIVGSGVDTALATINAASFTGATLSVTGTGSTSAMTVTATGAYNATITTGTGADTISGGSGNDVLSAGDGADSIMGGLGNDTIIGGIGNNVITGGSGDDSVTGGTGDENIDGGDGNDIIDASTGANTVAGGAGNDTITTSTGADSVTGGDGNDTITTNTGNDTVNAGAGDDTVDVGGGNDNVIAGVGSDTITGGSGDDTIDGGEGNDFITITSLSNGDSIDGGAGTDRLTISAISSDATPSGVANIEDFRVTSIGSSAAITVDLTKVTGMTALVTTNAQLDGTTLTVKNIPSTLTTFSIAEAISTTSDTDTLALAYSSGPSAATFNAFTMKNTATNITGLNAPLTINGKLNTDLAGTAVVYGSTMVNSFGTMSTDASTITIGTDALPAAIVGTELTIGNITNSVISALTVNGSAYSDISVGTLDTSSAELTTITLGSGTGATTAVSTITAASPTAIALTLNAGTQGTTTLASSTFAGAAVTVAGTLGDQGTVVGNTVIGKSIVSNNFTVGAGSTTDLPTLEVNAATGTIGASTITVGAASTATQTLGSTVAAKSIGAVTVSGSGSYALTIPATAAATSSTGVPAVGAISASAMTSSLSSLKVTGTNATSVLSLTGGGGNDTLIGGTIADTITGGVGLDSMTGNAGQDIFVFSAGDSNVVYTAIASTATGQDIITANSTDTSEQLLRFNITSADTTWNMAHILVGTAGGAVASATSSTTAGNTSGFTTATVLVQAGVAVAANTNSDDAFDIAVRMGTGLTAAQAQAMSVVNLTGTTGADTLSGGANNDTITGGDGADSIIGGAGGDSLVGGAGNDIYLIENTDSGIIAWTGTAYTANSTVDATNLDKITFLVGDTLQFGTISTVLSTTLGTVNTAPGDGKYSLVVGNYTPAVPTTGATALFTQTTSGTSTMVVWDSDTAATTTSYRAVILVGYTDTGTTDPVGTTGVTGLIGTA